MMYRLRYALFLYRHGPGLTLWEAWCWPAPDERGDPEEDAEAEIDCMET